MKVLSTILIFIVSFGVFSQITPNGNTGSETTAYTNGTPNDQIYIWCAADLTTYEGSLTANSPSGTGPFTFNWFYNDENTSSWVSLTSEVGMSSTLNNLPSDGYRVEIYDDMSVLVGCYVTWVWNLSSDVTVSQNIQDCDETDLTGTIISGSSFVYYNPPAPNSTITAATEISVCFDATHTYVSDLAFYLVGPASCGSPTILLSPNPGAIGQGSICNSENNVSNLCFTTQPAGNLDVCNNAPFSLTGTFSSYGPSNTVIDWSGLYGCNAAQADWAVQIYDCIGGDVGALTQASITFNNLETSCGSSPNISYSSGNINSAINDNSCTAQTASIFQVSEPSAPITIDATNSYTWTSSSGTFVFPNPTTSLTQELTNLPPGSTWLYLIANVSYNGINCEQAVDSVLFINTCCQAVADSGVDSLICTLTNLQLGTPALQNMSYEWTPNYGLNDYSLAQPSFQVEYIEGGSNVYTYTLTVTDIVNNCFVTDEVVIEVVNCFIDPPNVISLAAGSQNPLWYPNTNGIKDYEIVITNRWGNVVFRCDDMVSNCPWDGKSKDGSFVEEGTYFYLINAKTEGEQEIQKHGFIQVVK